MYIWDIETPSNYRKWNIIDLWDYLWDFYDDNAQEDPETYGAEYDGPDETEADIAWRASHAVGVEVAPGEFKWYWKFSNNRIVSKFYDLIFMWRQDITTENLYAKNYVYAQRNYYIISAEAWRVILRERYSDFKYMTSFKYDYTTGKRHYYDTIAEAAQLLYRTFGAWEHDKIDALTKLMYALRKDYDPVENYDKYSDIEIHKYGSETTNFKPEGSETTTLEKAGTETNELTKEGKEKTTNVNGAQTDTTAKIPYDGGNTAWKNTEKVEGASYTDTSEIEFGSNSTERKDTNELSYTDRTDTTTHEFDESREDNTWTQYGKTPSGTTDDRYDKTIEHTHGNIGVTTSQQMIQSQFPIEYYDEIEHYTVSEFVHKYLVLA